MTQNHGVNVTATTRRGKQGGVDSGAVDTAAGCSGSALRGGDPRPARKLYADA
jgi:hypothetical protein